MEKKTVLVVDDDALIRQIVVFALQAEGYQTVVAHNGSEAFAYLKNQSVDLILSDIQMPVMDGWSLVRLLSNQKAYAHLPIVLMSGTDIPESDIAHYPIGFISKPFTLSGLRTKVAQFVAMNNAIHGLRAVA